MQLALSDLAAVPDRLRIYLFVEERLVWSGTDLTTNCELNYPVV